MKMKIIILLVFFLFISASNAQDIAFPKIDTPIVPNSIRKNEKDTIKLPILEVQNEIFLKDLDSLVLNYKMHQIDIFKDRIYTINIGGDSLRFDNSINPKKIINIQLLIKNDDNINLKFTRGIFFRGDAAFIITGYNSDNLFHLTGKCFERIQNKNLINIKSTHDFPLWILYYVDGRLKLLHSEMVMTKDEYENPTLRDTSSQNQ